MIPLFTRDEMRALDREATERFGVPSILLMESAGVNATEHLVALHGDALARVVIVGGEGQNGGDGWVMARHLLSRGHTPRCFLIGDPAKVRGDAQVNLEALGKLGVDVAAIDLARIAMLTAALSDATLIVDGLFGTGLARPLTGVHARVVEAINGAEAVVCALDLPSGIDANTGQVLGVAVRARTTVTFAGHKRGLHQHPGATHAGDVRCVDIGVPAVGDGRTGLIEARDLDFLLRPKPRDAHKGSRGHVIAFAGSQGKTGAALLAGLGAIRGGAGLVTIATDEVTQSALQHQVVELMTAALGRDRLDSARALADGKAAALLGPGFGLDDGQKALARALSLCLPCPAVIDADALTALENDLTSLRDAAAPRVLTPHPGEAGRLLGCDARAVQADRFAAVTELAAQSGQVVVLKGAGTVIAAPDQRVRVCRAGTPALGVAGTGDVLTGVTAALLATKHPTFDVACAAVHLHAVAGELAAVSDTGMLASEVAHALPRALERLRGSTTAHSRAHPRA